jgi:dienelactone hydrolase
MEEKMKRFFLMMVMILFCLQISFNQQEKHDVRGIRAQDIHIYPKDGLVDERLTIRVSGLSSNQPAIIRAQMKDIDGRLWQSYAGFYADKNGVIDLSKQAPANGDYTGVDEMGLILSMELPLKQRTGARFTYRHSEPILIRFSLEVDGIELDKKTVTRRFALPGVKIQKVRGNSIVGTFFKPVGKEPFPGLIILGGSEGGLSTEEEAALFASHGYATLALAYFDMEELPKLLQEIPLEYFKKAINWMKSNRNVLTGKLGLVGTSKGAEAALLVGSYYPQIKTVVAYTPSSVVWSTIYGMDKSSWSYHDSAIPYIGPGRDPTYRPPRGYPIRPVVNFLYRLKTNPDIHKAVIPVERLNGPVLLISGKDDQLWPSYKMGKMIMERFRVHKFPFTYKHLAYDNAGHQIRKFYLPMAGSTAVAGGRLVLGGSIRGNINALRDSWPKVLHFLREKFVKR